MPFSNDTADVIHHLYCSLCLYMYNTQTNMQRHRQSSTLDRTIFYSPFRIMLIDDVVVLAVSELLTAQHTLTQIHHATGKHLFADEWNAEISIESIMMTAFEFFFFILLSSRHPSHHTAHICKHELVGSFSALNYIDMYAAVCVQRPICKRSATTMDLVDSTSWHLVWPPNCCRRPHCCSAIANFRWRGGR